MNWLPPDATKIIDGLYQGSGPTPGAPLKPYGFDVVILCAEEWQPLARFFDVEVIHAPFDDDTLNSTDWAIDDVFGWTKPQRPGECAGADRSMRLVRKRSHGMDTAAAKLGVE